MNRPLSEQLAGSMPMLCSALLIVLGAVPAPFVWLPAFPHVALCSVFFFALYAPRCMPFWGAFGLGLLTDIISGAPLGLHALLCLAACVLVVRNARLLSRQAFRVLWAAFGLAAMLYFAASALLYSWAMHGQGSWHTLIPWLGSTLLCYPLLHMLFSRMARLLPAA